MSFKSLIAVAMCLLFVGASAFVAPTSFATKVAAKAPAAMQMSAAGDVAKVAAGMAPAAALLSAAAPAFADSELIAQLPTQLVSLEVTFAAYLAVLLGTFVPVAFLVLLYIQSETRKAGEAAGRGE